MGNLEDRVRLLESRSYAANTRIDELERQRDAAQGADPLHPDGRCTCGGGGGGGCEWCRSHCVGCGVRLTKQAAWVKGRICDGCLAQDIAATAADQRAPSPAPSDSAPLSHTDRAQAILDWFMEGEDRDVFSQDAVPFIAGQIDEAVSTKVAALRAKLAGARSVIKCSDSIIMRHNEVHAALRAQLAEREAELAALKSSERERLIRALVAEPEGAPMLLAAVKLATHEHARRAKEK